MCTVYATVHDRRAKRRHGGRLYGPCPAKKRPSAGRQSFKALCARRLPLSQKPAFERGTFAPRQRYADGIAARCRHRTTPTTPSATKPLPGPSDSWRLRRVPLSAAGLRIRLPGTMPMPPPCSAGALPHRPSPCNPTRSRPLNLMAGWCARPRRSAGAVSTMRRPDGACGSGGWDGV